MVQWQPGIKLVDVEKDTILKAFAFYHGNKRQTAVAVGISLRTLHTRLQEYVASGTLIKYYAPITPEEKKEAAVEAKKSVVSEP